jgi:response regulator RpfG family c-di-GMP phosphodiesterase
MESRVAQHGAGWPMDRRQRSAPGSDAVASATGGGASPAERRPVVLIVDDDRDVATALAETLSPELDALATTSARAALAMLDEHDVAVLIADLRMPEMGGVDLLTEAHRRHPQTVGVLITAHADAESAVQAINEARAFAYLVKPWEADAILSFIRRAVDAHRAIRRDVRVQQERELQILDQLSRSAPVPVTAERFGAMPLREGLPDVFDDLLSGYAEAIEHALEQRVYKVDRQVSEALRRLADRLGALRAGPRDVIELHTSGMRRLLAGASAEQADAYAEEGRLLVLELMGHLVSYYRGYSLG